MKVKTTVLHYVANQFMWNCIPFYTQNTEIQKRIITEAFIKTKQNYIKMISFFELKHFPLGKYWKKGNGSLKVSFYLRVCSVTKQIHNKLLFASCLCVYQMKNYCNFFQFCFLSCRFKKNECWIVRQSLPSGCIYLWQIKEWLQQVIIIVVSRKG